MVVICKIDTSRLVAAQEIFSKYSRYTPAEALNRTVLFVVRDAQRRTPFVSMAQIDAELSIVTTPVLSTRGSRKGLPLRSGRKNVAVVEGGLATRIVLARLHRYSTYNVLTDMKYALDQASFSPGGGVGGFWAKVEEVAQRMGKSRHSATHFLQSTWSAVIKKLLPSVPRSYGGAGVPGMHDVSEDLAEVKPAVGGNARVTCMIANRVGMDERFPTISALRNAAAHRILEPVLQSAIDAEFESKMQEAGRRGWIDREPQLRALGWRVF